MKIWVKVALFVVIVAAVVSVEYAQEAYGHMRVLPNGEIADAGWIEKHYRDCCGEDDCFPIHSNDIKLVKGGWKVRGHPNVIPENEVRQSQDGKAWKCILTPDVPNSDVHCLFLPGAGV